MFPRDRQFVIAHRAGNSLARLRGLKALGVEAAEADVRLHNGRVEIRHSDRFGRLPVFFEGWKPVNPFEPQLVLDHLLRCMPDDMTLMLDLKGRDAKIARVVLDAIDKHEARGSIAVCTAAWSVLGQFEDRAEIGLLHTVGGEHELRDLRETPRERRLDGVSVKASMLDAESVTMYRDYADVVLAWTVNREREAQRLLDAGVDGIITDHPARIARLVPSP